tara:strand:+ start:1566 stop:2006 length:441 start_codon:yes stop_codon:yes gene_type:complete
MIYLIRHQQYEFSNCLNNLGVKNSNTISIQFLNKILNIITITPNIHHNKMTTHIRPLQTASIIATNTKNNLRVINKYNEITKFINKDTDNLIVWHHEEIPIILDYLTKKKNNFEWNEDNYSGCLLISNDMSNYKYINNIYNSLLIL